MKEILCINGGKSLRGEVSIGGAKNSLVAIIVASIITKSIVKLTNVKPIDDTYTLLKILNRLNVKTLYDDRDCLYIDSRNIRNIKLDNEEVMNMRASYYFMGALLSLYKKVEIIGPGGCNFGSRPIDLHLYAFECLGVSCEMVDNLYTLKRVNKGTNIIDFKKKSVGATINAILAGCKGKGKIVIKNCALEPEVDDLISFLNACGCDIKRDNESILINKVNYLHGCDYKVMFDRIEAGTFMIIGGLLSDYLKIKNIELKYLGNIIDVLKNIGVKVEEEDNYLVIRRSNNYRPINLIVNPYPGFPTDLQQPLTVLLSTCDGVSTIKETIYPARLSHVDSLNKMNANININEDEIIINGNRTFKNCDVSGKDLRGGISLVIAALLARGESKIDGVKYIKRGYSDLVYKLRDIGGDIRLEESYEK